MYQRNNNNRSAAQEDSWIDPDSWQQEPIYNEAPQHKDTPDDRVSCLVCTLAAMLPPLALFLVFAEKENRAIRHYAVQSLGLTAINLLCAAFCALVGTALGGIPFLGFVTTLVCWLIYLVILIVVLVARVRMMLCAWQGAGFVLPVMGRWLQKFC